jgi:hypothetical protein
MQCKQFKWIHNTTSLVTDEYLTPVDTVSGYINSLPSMEA